MEECRVVLDGVTDGLKIDMTRVMRERRVITARRLVELVNAEARSSRNVGVDPSHPSPPPPRGHHPVHLPTHPLHNRLNPHHPVVPLSCITYSPSHWWTHPASAPPPPPRFFNPPFSPPPPHRGSRRRRCVAVDPVGVACVRAMGWLFGCDFLFVQHAKAWAEVVSFLSKDPAEVRESYARVAAKLDDAGSESLL